MATAVSSDGQAPNARLSLRTAVSPAKRHSMTGNGSVSSPKGSSIPTRLQNGARLSSPGFMTAAANGNGSGPGSPVPGGAGSSSLHNSGDIPRLPRVSDTGDRRPAATMLRRSSTMSTAHMTREVMNSIGGPGSGPGGGGVGPIKEDGGPGSGPESVAALRRERNALRQEKAALLQNKRRLEGLINKMLEQQSSAAAGQEGDGGGGSGGGGAGGPRPPLVRTSTMRAQMLRALDESTGLDKQLGGDGQGAFEDAETRVRELTAKIAEMQAEHDVAVARLEGELAYRRTQAAASTAHLHKQLGEAEGELAETRRRAAAAEAQAKALSQEVTELRGQVSTLNVALADKTRQAQDLKDMLGMDKATLLTVNEMLKEQLRDANADRQAKIQHIAELEYALVHRDALLAEAHERMNAAAAQAAAAAAGASSAAAATAAAAVARVSTSGVGGGVGGGGTMDPRSAWTAMAKAPRTVPSPRAGRNPSNGSIGGGRASGGGAGGGGGKSRAAHGEATPIGEQSSYAYAADFEEEDE